jgi:hypothetical protein
MPRHTDTQTRTFSLEEELLKAGYQYLLRREGPSARLVRVTVEYNTCDGLRIWKTIRFDAWLRQHREEELRDGPAAS